MSDSISDKDKTISVTKMLEPTGPSETLDSKPQVVEKKQEPMASTPIKKMAVSKDVALSEMSEKKSTPKQTLAKKPAQQKIASSNEGAPSLSTYMDYRLYLEDFLKFKRSQKLGIRKYSPSDFAAAADLKSPQYLKLVIERQRNLSEDGALKFCKALGLNKEESSEFVLLVMYNQATQPKERYDYLQKLSEHRAKNITNLKSPHWLKVIIYSICEGLGGSYTIDDFKTLLGDKGKPAELQQCLEEMASEKAITVTEHDGKTYYEKSPGQNTLSNDIPIDVIKKIQADLLLLALESLFSDSPKDRDLGSFSIALTEKEFEETKFEIRKFRKSLLKNLLMKRELGPGERVYQVQFQIFPVTK